MVEKRNSKCNRVGVIFVVLWYANIAICTVSLVKVMLQEAYTRCRTEEGVLMGTSVQEHSCTVAFKRLEGPTPDRVELFHALRHRERFQTFAIWSDTH